MRGKSEEERKIKEKTDREVKEVWQGMGLGTYSWEEVGAEERREGEEGEKGGRGGRGGGGGREEGRKKGEDGRKERGRMGRSEERKK